VRRPRLAHDDTCSLGDAICDNAEVICTIAGELRDGWSRDKCTSANASGRGVVAICRADR
jgi:hypothetical protein